MAEEGLPGVRIDRIAAGLGVSKGSFHHHFDGAAAYRLSLLERYETQAVAAMERATADASAGGLEQLDALVASLERLYDARIETALRAWAIHDADAQRVMAGIDRARLAMLQEIWADIVPDPRTARTAALIPHLIVIGASASPTTAQDLAAVMRLLARVAPAIPELPGDAPI
ncbi:transcriptional regulator, TetR family [Glycomyces harbinensis]|uniref:Transcriptional regulator, TetR family n=1 Tax=Glycomyces harbinensis TaxID=58114 RepID=A0A1G6XHR7_9ACTN|nr:transcriptional regulator, TetR family [Glycomyces harbinensis]